MRITCFVAVLTILAAGAASASVAAEAPPPLAASWTHIRPLTPSATALLAEAVTRASAVRTQLETLERTDVVVYLTDSAAGSGTEPLAYLRFVSAAGGIRYVIIQIERWAVAPTDRIAWLGHELQHALEIAYASDVRDDSGVRRLYQRIGWQCERRQFETLAARAVGTRIWNELAGRGAPR